jgi:SAM-dependent methyltransferase
VTGGRRGGTGDPRYHPLTPSFLFERQQLERGLCRDLARAGWVDLSGARILDLGTGSGIWLVRLMSLGARPDRLFGVDLLALRLAAGKRVHPGLGLLRADGVRLPFPDGTFDLTFQCTMLSGILEEETRARVIREMARVTRPGGTLFWYDMRVRRPDNRRVRPVGPREARRFLPGATVTSRPVTLNPVLARLLVPRAWPVADLLGGLPPFCGHRLTTIELPGGDGAERAA